MVGRKIIHLIKLSLVIIFLCTGIFIAKEAVFAQVSAPDLGLQPVESAIGLPSTDIRLVVARIIKTALGLLGIVALVLILYGGFVWMTAGGDEEKISQSKKILLNSVIGLAIILSSYAIASFVINKLVDATGGSVVENGGGPGSGGNPYFPSDIFYVDSLPQGGSLCVRNVHAAITFNRPVNVGSLNGNVVVRSAAGAEYPGEWSLVSPNTAVFVPNGDCGSGPSDCFAATTEYSVHFLNPSQIMSGDGQLSLNCSIKAGCADVRFTTGEGIDRSGPRITIDPIANDVLRSGSVIPVVISFSDDNGVQKVDLSADNFFVGSQTISGCQKTGSVTVNWPTSGIGVGQHTLLASGYDWSGLSDNTSTVVNLLPQHCFDNSLQADLGEIVVGPPACGGECGACVASACTNNAQCASGFCDTVAGVCIDKMRINAVSPLSGGPGTLVTISGNYFGNVPGKVFLNNREMPLATMCGAGAWRPWQIVAEVPQNATSGSIRVETATSTVGLKFTDATNDNFGPRVSDFEVNAIVRPGICSINPASGLPGTEVSISGKRLGAAPGQVSFGGQNVLVSLANWADTLVKARVPLLNNGAVGVKVTQNNIDSNSVRYFVDAGLNDSAPVISAISPDHGAKGSYITITGKNFGSQLGRVWFKENNNGQPGEAIEGDFNFPAGCRNTWSDTQIIVKFPPGSGQAGSSYFVQVRPADASLGWSPIGPIFAVENGEPNPGICNITPVSGPVPFSNEAPPMEIKGEYFGSSSSVYFWTEGSSATGVSGRLAAGSVNITNLAVGQSIAVKPPVGTRTGPVVVFRETDDKISNPANFSVLDCVRNNNTCSIPNTHCCASGSETGLCIPNNQLCQGETFTGGYVWRISTKDIPKVPHVVERCNSQTELGLNLPSPSPSVQWDSSVNDVHHNICRSASVSVEFSLPAINSIPRSELVINECQPGSANENSRTCTVAESVPVAGAGDLIPLPSTENTSYLELNPEQTYNSGKWKDNTWYQVVLKSSISVGSGTSTANLAQDKPCGAGTSYCFVFRTGAQDCRMKSVVITPYSYWTSVLEEPIKRRELSSENTVDLLYNGHGLSTQKCVIMNTDAFTWSWGSKNNFYADIFSANNDEAKVSALANTVGVGLTNPGNSVYINATATLASARYAGVSPLTIDLNNPEVVDFWPKCFESCTNAEVGVRFNTSMSNKNLPGSALTGPIKLLKCNDENCLNTTPAFSALDIVLDGNSEYKILKIANSSLDSLELEPDTLYQVIVSASSTDVSTSNLLWSASRLGDPSTASKPYNKSFVWRFKTKRDRCKIDRVDVSPSLFVAQSVADKKIFSAQPYSSPDTCSVAGQKLNPWLVSWNWTTSDMISFPNVVASLKTFVSKGTNNFCTKNCVRKGSAIAAGSATVPMCGNGVVEAGEDCDPPFAGSGCGIDCRRTGNQSSVTCGNGVIEPSLGEICDPADANSSLGCTSVCLRAGSAPASAGSSVSASICGNGTIGAGEDCDTGIAANASVVSSGMNCSATCQHQGTKLFNSWCFANAASRAGFVQNIFDAACKNALSQCGDGVTSPDEDAGCDLGGGNKAAWCNNNCVNNNTSHPECVAGSEGCSSVRQNTGSSLLYSEPSLCGDGVVGIGEDGFCESNLNGNRTGSNPWSLAQGVGMGVSVGVPATQKSMITASTNENTASGVVSDSGQFTIPCGYTTDGQCEARMGSGWGVATNGCCYMRPKLLSVVPGTTSTERFNICPNTAIEAVFDQPIDVASIKNNVLVARGTTSSTCGAGEDVTSLAVAFENNANAMPWYKKVFATVIHIIKYLTGQEAAAVRTEIRSTKWCAGEDTGQLDVETVSTTQSKIVFRLTKPLALDSDYLIVLKNNIKSKLGIAIGNNIPNNKPVTWKFITGSNVCEIDRVSVSPSQVYFDRVNATSTISVSAYNVSGAKLQSIPGHYAWDYLWQPTPNSYVSLENTTSSVNVLAAKNRNGEIDIRASSVIRENYYSAQTGMVATGKTRAIVFLCENPWPPKDLFLNGSGPFRIFPYEDKLGNNDGFSLASDTFNNTPIPPSPSGGYFNFRSYYCADRGNTGTADDLPYLRPVVQVSTAVVSDSPTSSLKRFIFTNAKNNDAIGIAVFSNPQHLTVNQWFEDDRSLGGQGFTGTMQATTINGYEAITDGNNIYVDALNYSDTSGNLFSNIYLFSVNANASQETKDVFEQLVANLNFNTNLTNFGYCGVSMANPGASTTCQTDLDCGVSEVCSVQVDKLKRNYIRLRDLNEIQSLINN